MNTPPEWEIVCTGRRTHAAAYPEVTEPPPPRHSRQFTCREFRCPVCTRTWRFGKRRYARLMAAQNAAFVAGVPFVMDVSFL